MSLGWQHHGFTDPGPEHLLLRVSPSRILPSPIFKPFEFFQVPFMKFTPPPRATRTYQPPQSEAETPARHRSSAHRGLQMKKHNPSLSSSQDTQLNLRDLLQYCHISWFEVLRFALDQFSPAPTRSLANPDPLRYHLVIQSTWTCSPTPLTGQEDPRKDCLTSARIILH